MRFDVVDSRLFVAVVEAGSITHGATRVNLALGSASARITQMEEAVGVPLLVRQRLGVSAGYVCGRIDRKIKPACRGAHVRRR